MKFAASSTHRRGTAMVFAIVLSIVITGLVSALAWVGGPAGPIRRRDVEAGPSLLCPPRPASSASNGIAKRPDGLDHFALDRHHQRLCLFHKLDDRLGNHDSHYLDGLVGKCQLHALSDGDADTGLPSPFPPAAGSAPPVNSSSRAVWTLWEASLPAAPSPSRGASKPQAPSGAGVTASGGKTTGTMDRSPLLPPSPRSMQTCCPAGSSCCRRKHHDPQFHRSSGHMVADRQRYTATLKP